MISTSFLLAALSLVFSLSHEPSSQARAFTPNSRTIPTRSTSLPSFSPSPSPRHSLRLHVNDPTKSPIASLADKIQTILAKTSPLNAAKLSLVKSLAGDYDAAATRQKLDGLISENPVLMLSFTTCPFCIKAKSVLDAKGSKDSDSRYYKVVELDVEGDGKAIRAEMGEMLGRTSVPAIWIGGGFVGGCNDGPLGGIVKLEESGKLDGMLKNVGVL
mmetsp:Transcript_17107/g.34581  ORF Transcript_17107/g.34581 Transcript_17107/m.34581 type:complete len:216 (+) Transcript_17107:67-714(+)